MFKTVESSKLSFMSIPRLLRFYFNVLSSKNLCRNTFKR